MRQATKDDALSATLLTRHPLRYARGADAALDRPAHVRAGSALLRLGGRHVAIQDDALFLAHILPDGRVEPETLPAADGVRQFDDLRGNKHHKLDLEAACLWPSGEGELALAWGSGSSPARERVLVLRHGHPPRLADAGPLYAALRAAIAGAELNIEGAWRTAGGQLRMLQRGNGIGACDAVFELDGAVVEAILAGAPLAPVLRRADRWSLGQLDGVRLTWTDAMPWRTGWLFSAAAEDSPDAIADGPVSGSAIGWCDDAQARWTPIRGPGGEILQEKVEGIAPADRPDELLLITDPDDPVRPAELMRVRLGGPWPGLS